MRQKGSAPIIIFILIVLAVVGYSSYKSYLPNLLVKPTPAPTSNPTANWKTYTDKVFGYSIKYPEDWECNVQGEPLYNYGSRISLRPKQDDSSIIKKLTDFGLISVEVIRSEGSLESFVEKNWNQSGNYIKEIVNTTLDGRIAKKVVFNPNLTITELVMTKVNKPDDLHVMYKDIFYILTLHHIGGSDPFINIALEEREKFFNDIVSTFKFTQ